MLAIRRPYWYTMCNLLIGDDQIVRVTVGLGPDGDLFDF